jgi:hypothetical protein
VGSFGGSPTAGSLARAAPRTCGRRDERSLSGATYSPRLGRESTLGGPTSSPSWISARIPRARLASRCRALRSFQPAQRAPRTRPAYGAQPSANPITEGWQPGGLRCPRTHARPAYRRPSEVRHGCQPTRRPGRRQGSARAGQAGKDPPGRRLQKASPLEGEALAPARMPGGNGHAAREQRSAHRAQRTPRFSSSGGSLSR